MRYRFSGRGRGFVKCLTQQISDGSATGSNGSLTFLATPSRTLVQRNGGSEPFLTSPVGSANDWFREMGAVMITAWKTEKHPPRASNELPQYFRLTAGQSTQCGTFLFIGLVSKLVLKSGLDLVF